MNFSKRYIRFIKAGKHKAVPSDPIKWTYYASAIWCVRAGVQFPGYLKRYDHE